MLLSESAKHVFGHTSIEVSAGTFYKEGEDAFFGVIHVYVPHQSLHYIYRETTFIQQIG